jgi:hypothetical protein
MMKILILIILLFCSQNLEVYNNANKKMGWNYKIIGGGGFQL